DGQAPAFLDDIDRALLGRHVLGINDGNGRGQQAGGRNHGWAYSSGLIFLPRRARQGSRDNTCPCSAAQDRVQHDGSPRVILGAVQEESRSDMGTLRLLWRFPAGVLWTLVLWSLRMAFSPVSWYSEETDRRWRRWIVRAWGW